MRVLRSGTKSSNSDSSVINTTIKKSRRTKKRRSSKKNFHEESNSTKENIRPKDDNSISDNQDRPKDNDSIKKNETLNASRISAVRRRKLSNKSLNVSISKENNQKFYAENEGTSVSCVKQRSLSASKENQSSVAENEETSVSCVKQKPLSAPKENQSSKNKSSVAEIVFNETRFSQLADTSCILINDTTFEQSKNQTKRNETFELNDTSNVNPNASFEKLNGTFEKIDNELIQSRNRRSSRRNTYQIKNTSGQWSVEDISNDKSKEKSNSIKEENENVENDDSVIYIDTTEETDSEKTLLKVPQNLNGTFDTPSKSNRKKWVKFEPETTITTQSPILRKSNHFITNKNSITSSTPFAKCVLTPGKFDRSKNSVSVSKNKSLIDTSSKNSVARNKSLMEISSHSKSIKKSARKPGHVPNFAKIHEKIYSELESVVEASERKKIRAEKLLSGKKPENPEPLKLKTTVAKSSEQLFGKIAKIPLNTAADIKNSPYDKKLTMGKITINSSSKAGLNVVKNSPKDKSFTIDKIANKPLNSADDIKNSPIDKKFTIEKNRSIATNINDIKNIPRDKSFTIDKTAKKPLNSTDDIKNSPFDKKIAIGKIAKNSRATKVDDGKKSPKDTSFTIDKIAKKPLNSSDDIKNSPIDKKIAKTSTATNIDDTKKIPKDKNFTINKIAKKSTNSTDDIKNSPIDKKIAFGKIVKNSTATDVDDTKKSPKDTSFTIDKIAKKPTNSTDDIKNSPIDKKIAFGKIVKNSTATDVDDTKKSPKDTSFTIDKIARKPTNSTDDIKNSPIDKKIALGKIAKNSTVTDVDDTKKSLKDTSFTIDKKTKATDIKNSPIDKKFKFTNGKNPSTSSNINDQYKNSPREKDKSFTIDKTAKKPSNTTSADIKNSPIDKKFTFGKIKNTATNTNDIKKSSQVIPKNMLSQIPRFNAKAKAKPIIIQKPKTPAPKLQINDKTLTINTTFSPKTNLMEPNVKSVTIAKPQVVKSVFSKGHIQAVANKTKTSEKSAKIDNRRNQIKGVRSNRRFDLLMQMRGN